MDLSIVIVNWRTRDFLAECLNSVFSSNLDRNVEVLVVDNCSNDGSAELINEQFPDVRLIVNSTNVGFARANNQAIIKTSGKNILLLNPDTILKNDAINLMVDYLALDPGAGVVGPRLLNPDGTLQVSAFPEPTLPREFWRMFHLDEVHHYAEYPMNEWSIEAAKEVDVLMGACFLVRRKVLDQVGLLDGDFFVYSEEVDLCTRIREFGWRLIWLPTAEVIHFGGQSTQQVSQEMFLQLYQGKVQYFRKHHSTPEVWLYKFVLLLATLARLMLTPFAYLESYSKNSELLELLKNYRQLLQVLPKM